MENELFERILENRGDLNAGEWRSLKVALEEDPRLADRLHELLLTDELLSQKFSPDRCAFTAAVESRIESEGGHQISLEDVKSLDRRRRKSDRRSFRQSRRTAVAAALLFITSSLIALWLSQNPQKQPPLTQREQRRHRVIVEQLRELSLEREAVEKSKTQRRPRPKPAAPAPKEATHMLAELEVRAVEAAKEAEEVARMIDARRRFVIKQLRRFERPRDSLPDNLDVEESDSQFPAPSREPVVAGTDPVEVGRVLLTADGEGTAQLIRQTERGPTRHELSQGLPLLSGDRIQTPHGKGTACASVQLDGGATLDLADDTTIEVLGRDNLRLHTGRIYAHIKVPVPDDGYLEGEPPFSLQTEAGRFLTHDVQAEIHLSSNKVLRKDLTARVDGGKVHLVNHRGHTVGRRGQEMHSKADARPIRREGFSRPIWRGCERHFANLPFGSSSPIILSTYTPVQHSGMHYALAMALRGEISLRGLQTTLGPEGETRERLQYFQELVALTRRLQPRAPGRIPPATLGVLRPLQVPPSRNPKRTRWERSDAVLQILAAAQRATPRKPLLVLCHGAMTDVACAWLMDPSIAQRVVVAGEKNRGRDTWSAWNWDPWAGEIVYRHFRCVLLYHDGLPTDRALLERINDPKWLSLKDNRTGQHHKFSLLYHVSNPAARMDVRRIRLTGTRDGKPVFETDPKGNTWEIQSRVKRGELLTEFHRIFLTSGR